MQLIALNLYKGKRICVALSGGADSVCLLHLFQKGRKEYAIELSAVHVEHGIRGEESLLDMRFCKELCESWDIPLYIERRDVPALSKEQKLSLEEAARKARYEVFSSLIQEGKCDFVATAHHEDDVAETILFRLARGTSPTGMRAIGKEGGIVRPLLHVPHEKILAYVEENSLPFREDSSNEDENYTRNYIRRTVLPAFEKIHGGAKEHLIKFAAQCSRDDEFLTHLAKKEIKVCHGERAVPVSLPEPLFLRACLACMDVEKDYESANLQAISSLKNLQSGKKVCLPRGQFAVREYENIVFYYPAPPIEPHPFGESDILPPSKGKLRADLDAIPKGSIVRTRREGDFIIPFGGRSKSLKKFFTDRKISARVGRGIPLITFGSEVLIVCGVEISDKVKVTENSTHIGYF